MATETDRVKQQIDATRRELADDIERLGAGRRVSDVRGWLRSMKDRVIGTTAKAAEVVQDAPGRVSDAAQGSPIGVGLIAVGAGLVAAALVPETEVERKAARHFGDQLGPAMEPLQDAGRGLATDIRSMVASAASEVGSAAARAASEVSSAARTGAVDVAHSAQQAVRDSHTAGQR